MADKMNLHTNEELFIRAVKETADNLGIKEYFIEKDYWISLVLKRLSECKYAELVVFKGGTSLSKGHKLINRFSEDLDVAVIIEAGITGNQMKTMIRTVEKEISRDIVEMVVDGVTSKGSRFRKGVYEYPLMLKQKPKFAISNTVIVEINSFSNPFPYSNIPIQSMIGEYLESHNQYEILQQFGLEAFGVQVLNKEQTLIEKLVSLIRFSFDNNPVEGVSGKIRHFYDLYYLLQDEACRNYLNSGKLKSHFHKVLAQDQLQFDDPADWKAKRIEDSPLIQDFDLIWEKVKASYTNELSIFAYSEIPNEEEVSVSFKELLKLLV